MKKDQRLDFGCDKALMMMMLLICGTLCWSSIGMFYFHVPAISIAYEHCKFS